MSLKEINELYAKALDDPGFQRALVHVAEEKATRPVRPCRCVVVEIPETAPTDEFAHVKPGTVSAFVGREGEPLLRRLAETIKSNNDKAFTAAASEIAQMGADFSRKVTEAGTYAEGRPQPFPSFAEISYANKTLTSYVFVDDVLPVQVHFFPYNGGHLDRKRFAMIEYYRAGADTPLTCLLIIRRPTLSEIEREALRLVPSGSSANNIAAAVVEPFTPAILAFLVVAAEAAARFLYNEFVNWFVCILHGCGTILTSKSVATLDSEEFQQKLKSLPPEVTAAELLRLRTELLLQSLSK
jgi:hypothetical protein